MPSVNDVYPSKFLCAADLKGQAKTVNVEFVETGIVGQGEDAKTQLLVTFREYEKQLGLNKTNATAIANLFGDDTDDWVGESLVLFPTKVDFGGRMVDAIRVDERQSRTLLQAKLKAQKAAGPRKNKAGVQTFTQAELDAEIGPEPARSPGEDDDIPFN